MKDKQRGTIIIISFITIAILLTISTYFLNSIITETKISKSIEEASRAHYLAEAGINEAIWKLENDPIWSENFISEDLNPDINGNYWQDSFERDSFKEGSYLVTIQNSARGYGEIISTSEVDFFDKKSQRKIKARVFRGLDSPVFDSGIFTGGSSENVSISHSKLTIYNGNIYSGNNLDISGASEVRVYNNPETDKVEGQIISSKEIKLKGGSIIEYTALCSENDCYEDCESCPPEDFAAPLVDFNSDSDYSFKKRAESFENDGYCSVFCKPDNQDEYLCSNQCVFSGKEFENLLSEVGDSGSLILENKITYVNGAVNIEDNIMLDIRGVLVVDGHTRIGTKKPKSGDIGSHIKITSPGPNQASGLLSAGKLDMGESSLREETLIEGVIYAYDEMTLTSLPYKMEILGALISRKFSINSVFEGIEITLDNDKIMRGLGYLIGDEVINPTFSPILRVDHWEEVY